MKFIDSTKIKVAAGKGGDGFISFRREAHVDKGGPDGGDGGDGGSVYFIGDSGMNTLLSLHFQKTIKGEDGVKGGRKNLYGARGKDIFVKVPFGTQVINDGKIIADVIDEKPYLICKGGKGGRGNAKFKTAKNSAPRLNENGMPGEMKIVDLELKVLADVGFVGVPNAGKSSLLSAMSNAKPKIANYQFTTIDPQLGLSKYYDKSFVVADLPGLIEGAAQGKGMGHEFLKHIERCKIIAHIIDFSLSYEEIKNNYNVIRKELKSYKIDLSNKKQILVANKNDKEGFWENIEEFEKEFNVKLIKISALNSENINELKATIVKDLEAETLQQKNNNYEEEVYINFDAPYYVKKEEGVFVISGSKVEYWYNRIPLTTNDNWLRFNKILQNLGVYQKLHELGIKQGDQVRIYNFTFEWND
ncbi:GTPase ObgE [Mycoplasma phocimorsus]|uniref:GTPase ObgE n=1 Tax=Mycoplasma phocimorsus TaxID=3045839 RepID=UPI0024BF8409|nr:GTPase ObgE [Mycoplasma phocimorsus]MDJ1647249.1 GTPase ObgE [Mycoplasma phocimorsus]